MGFVIGRLSSFQSDDGESTEFRDPGRDPNIFWGICGPSGRHRIYLMLPSATEEEIEKLHPIIYQANYEAAQLLLLENTTTWSPTYEAELDRTARFTNTHYRTESRKSISAEVDL